jgi:hypothetical protein
VEEQSSVALLVKHLLVHLFICNSHLFSLLLAIYFYLPHYFVSFISLIYSSFVNVKIKINKNTILPVVFCMGVKPGFSR